jgi:hypothetical protein
MKVETPEQREARLAYLKAQDNLKKGNKFLSEDHSSSS